MNIRECTERKKHKKMLDLHCWAFKVGRGRALFSKGQEEEGCDPEIITAAANHKASYVFQAWELPLCFPLLDCLSL